METGQHPVAITTESVPPTLVVLVVSTEPAVEQVMHFVSVLATVWVVSISVAETTDIPATIVTSVVMAKEHTVLHHARISVTTDVMTLVPRLTVNVLATSDPVPTTATTMIVTTVRQTAPTRMVTTLASIVLAVVTLRVIVVAVQTAPTTKQGRSTALLRISTPVQRSV